jgi:serine/threonine protein kinase
LTHHSFPHTIISTIDEESAGRNIPKEVVKVTDRLGQQLGNYRLVRLLGQGGFAEVYLGEHIYLKAYAAIKVLQARFADSEIQQFLTEAQTLVRLRHPHIVKVLEFGMEGNTPYLIMDYAPNGSLRQRHPRGVPLPSNTIVPYVKQVASALHYAHDQKLVHCDIKPENMLLGHRNEILLSDFGLAVIVQSSYYQTLEMMGTVYYMAPELVQGKPRAASDQYSLAVVVYEWLCGSLPFQGTFEEVIGQHAFVPPPPLHEKVLDILPAVEEVVLIALAKDPGQRFKSVQPLPMPWNRRVSYPSHLLSRQHPSIRRLLMCSYPQEYCLLRLVHNSQQPLFHHLNKHP